MRLCKHSLEFEPRNTAGQCSSNFSIIAGGRRRAIGDGSGIYVYSNVLPVNCKISVIFSLSSPD